MGQPSNSPGRRLYTDALLCLALLTVSLLSGLEPGTMLSVPTFLTTEPLGLATTGDEKTFLLYQHSYKKSGPDQLWVPIHQTTPNT